MPRTEYNKKYREENREYLRKYKAKWRRENREKIQKYDKKWRKGRRSNDNNNENEQI